MRGGTGGGSTPGNVDFIRRDLGILAALVALAVGVRLIPLLRGAGLLGMVDYDDGVYFGSTLALLRGVVVYRDFIIVHPPGILYVLSPFAALGAVVPDGVAFAAARLGFMALGAVNVVLVALVGRRVGRAAALTAAALYAIWQVPAIAERTTWLIAPQSTLLLVALLILPAATADRDAERARLGAARAFAVGVLLGACACLQIWAVVPAAVIFGWLVWTARAEPRFAIRLAAAYVAGGVLAALVLIGPFLLAAGQQVLRYIVFDQIGRNPSGLPLLPRLRGLEGVPLASGAGGVPDVIAIGVFLTLAAVVAVGAWRRRRSRPWALLLGAQVVLLLVTPSFFQHYAAWIAPAAVLTISATMASFWSADWPERLQRLRGPARIGLTMAAAVVLLFFSVRSRVGSRLDIERLTADVAGATCVTSDAPVILIETDLLRQVIARGCPLLVSPTGVSYDTDRDLTGSARHRRAQIEYQQIMADYFGSSDAAFFVRLANDAFSNETWAVIRRELPVELNRGRVMVRLRASP